MSPTVYTAEDNQPIDIAKTEGILVLVTVPAAFSGTCTSACIPSIIQHLDKIKEEGAERILVVSSDQPFAIQQWMQIAKWQDSSIEFASDFGDFEVRNIVGKLSDEEGKGELPPDLGNLLRRSYAVYKDGNQVWQFIEPDTGEYTLNIQDLLSAIKNA